MWHLGSSFKNESELELVQVPVVVEDEALPLVLTAAKVQLAWSFGLVVVGLWKISIKDCFLLEIEKPGVMRKECGDCGGDVGTLSRPKV